MEFGQIPKQIFKVPHPQRRKGLQLLLEPTHIAPENTNKGNFLDLLFVSVKIILFFFIEILDPWKNVTSLKLDMLFSTHKDTVSSLIITSNNTKVISVGYDSKLKVFSLSQSRQIRSANIGDMPLSSCIQLPDMNILVIGSFDNNM